MSYLAQHNLVGSRVDVRPSNRYSIGRGTIIGVYREKKNSAILHRILLDTGEILSDAEFTWRLLKDEPPARNMPVELHSATRVFYGVGTEIVESGTYLLGQEHLLLLRLETRLYNSAPVVVGEVQLASRMHHLLVEELRFPRFGDP